MAYVQYGVALVLHLLMGQCVRLPCAMRVGAGVAESLLDLLVVVGRAGRESGLCTNKRSVLEGVACGLITFLSCALFIFSGVRV